VSGDTGQPGAPEGDGRAEPEAHLDDALERVAHGATVSVPSILAERALTLAFTALLTNAFAPGAYGAFALARRFGRYLRRIAMGFGRGLSRYLPTAADPAERNALATFAACLLVAVAAALGAALYLATPAIVSVTGEGALFGRLLRLFALGLPATAWLFAVVETLRGIEAVGPLNLTVRVGFPAAQLAVGAAGVFLLDDLRAVALGVVVVMGLVGVLGAAWLVARRGFRPHFGFGDLQRRYLRFTAPLFAGGLATTTQRLGFYPLIAVFLTSVAGGVFAVGALVGGLVRLPLMGINQFAPPVAAALHDADHREALKRFYHVTSRLVLVGTTALTVLAIVYRESVMAVFGPAYAEFAYLLPGFVLAQFGACAAGSVGILLMMTDHQRALLVTNVAITAFLAVTAVPLVVVFGLPGLVGGYLLMLTVNNGVEVLVLYKLEGLQPFTKRHLEPLAAALPMGGVAVVARGALPGAGGVALGATLGILVYAAVLRFFGFTRPERRLAATLVERYRAALPTGL